MSQDEGSTRPWSLLRPEGEHKPDQFQAMYGDDAVFDPVGKFTLVHLDQPDEETRRKRIEEFDPDEYFLDDCVVCAAMKEIGGDIIYDEREFEE